jgi:DNA-binding transcriptional regulator YhcF (GntR family)
LRAARHVARGRLAVAHGQAPGQRLLARRRAEFTQRYVEPLLTEAARLGIGTGELFALIKEAGNKREGVSV